jgi:hypothetical protein
LALWEDEGGLEEKNALDTTEFEWWESIFNKKKTFEDLKRQGALI